MLDCHRPMNRNKLRPSFLQQIGAWVVCWRKCCNEEIVIARWNMMGWDLVGSRCSEDGATDGISLRDWLREQSHIDSALAIGHTIDFATQYMKWRELIAGRELY